jgi:hypothetical protein
MALCPADLGESSTPRMRYGETGVRDRPTVRPIATARGEFSRGRLSF